MKQEYTFPYCSLCKSILFEYYEVVREIYKTNYYWKGNFKVKAKEEISTSIYSPSCIPCGNNTESLTVILSKEKVDLILKSGIGSNFRIELEPSEKTKYRMKTPTIKNIKNAIPKKEV